MSPFRQRLWNVFVRRLLVLELPLSEETVQREHPDAVRCGWITAEDLEEYRAVRPDQDRASLVDRWADGHRCVGIWKNGRLCGTGWLSAGPLEVPLWYLNRSVRLGSDQAAFFDTYMHPDARRQRLSSIRSSWMRRQLHLEGVAVALAFVAPENEASLRMCTGMGYRRTGVLSSLGFLDHRVVWSSADAGQTVPEVVRRSFVRRSSEREHSI